MNLGASFCFKAICVFFLAWVITACGGAPASNSGGTSSSSNSSSSSNADGSIKLGSGSGASFVNQLSSTLVTSGTTPVWEIKAVVADADGIAVSDVYSVSFTSPCVAASLSTLSVNSVSTLAGRAATQYTAGTCDGKDTVIASVIYNEETITASVDLDVDAARTGSGSSGVVEALPRMGSGVGSAFVEGQIAVTAASIVAGGSVDLTVTIVDGSNGAETNLPADEGVLFTSSCVSNGLASFDFVPVSLNLANYAKVVGGVARATYTAEGCSGADTIQAQYVYSSSDGVVLTAETQVSVEVDDVSSVRFESATNSLLAIAGIGGQESSVVKFKLIGAQGTPIVGETVSFELSNTAGGAKISAGAGVGLTNSEGIVSTTVQSGTVNSSLRVIATHDASGTKGFSNDITISTGVPVSRSFDLSADRFNPPAANTNGIKVVITADVTDQFGNPPPDGTSVSFRSVEAGSVTPSCTLVNGTCSVTWSSSGDRNVITEDTQGRGFRATVIGFMSGSEDYTDFNGNGFFDPTNADEVASVVDLGEAFVDQNEDGIHNPGEDFVDSFINNGSSRNNQHDDAASGGPSYTGFYNGPCSSVLRADCPPSEFQSTIIMDDIVIVLASDYAALCSTGNLPAPDSPITLTGDTLSIVGLQVCDINGNSMPEGTSINVSGFGTKPIDEKVPNIFTEPYSISKVMTDTSTTKSGTLVLEIKSGSVTTVFQWPWTKP